MSAAASLPMMNAGENWSSHGGGSDESGYSTLAQINGSNVGALGLAWYVDLPGQSTLEATPLAINGVLYFTGTNASVYAIDGSSGRQIWRFDPETWKYDPAKMHYIFGANRGVAYAHGRIFTAALDGRLFALDAKTSNLLWSVRTVDRTSFQTITGAPRAFDGMVIVGNGGADYGSRGYVTAYDQKTGRERWRFYTVPGTEAQNRGHPSLEQAAATWRGEYWKTGTGGDVWDSIAFDQILNRIYLGTGNPGPWNPKVRSPGGGANLYTDCIVALDAGTGKLLWYYQQVPRDEWDYDATQTMILADLVIGGEKRQVLMQAPKDGFFYVLDRRDGRLISGVKIGRVTWAKRIDLATGLPMVNPDDRYENRSAVTVWPSMVGAHSWQPMSFSPKTGLTYIPYMQLGERFSVAKPTIPGAVNYGVWVSEVAESKGDGHGALLAWDPVHQRAAWKVPLKTMWNGGILATAGNLVFQGAGDGYFSAYDASTGRRLWRFNAGLGIIAAPMTFRAGGKQYVSVLVGYGGGAASSSGFMNVGWTYGQPRRLLTFAVGGEAALPRTVASDSTATLPPIPVLDGETPEVASGRAIYSASCGLCHGLNLVSTGGPAPDLRASRIPDSPHAFWQLLHGGALLPGGMPRFDSFTRKQMMDLRAYIRAGAQAALERGRSQSPAGSAARAGSARAIGTGLIRANSETPHRP
jgi:quinohemoprotein ethanol dehydrogenase